MFLYILSSSLFAAVDKKGQEEYDQDSSDSR